MIHLYLKTVTDIEQNLIWLNNKIIMDIHNTKKKNLEWDVKDNFFNVTENLKNCSTILILLGGQFFKD